MALYSAVSFHKKTEYSFSGLLDTKQSVNLLLLSNYIQIACPTRLLNFVSAASPIPYI